MNKNAILMTRRKIGCAVISLAVALMEPRVVLADDLGSSLHNQYLSCTVRADDGSYEIRSHSADHPILRAIVAVEIDHRWLKSRDYPKHQISRGEFQDELGHGQLFTVTSSGLTSRPDLAYVLRLYDSLPFGDIEVEVLNRTAKPTTVQAIRSLEALGGRLVDLGGRDSRDRVLSDSFSENRPALRIYDLGRAPQGMHRAVGSQLIYNQDSRQSLFLGALSSRRFLTIMHLQTRAAQNGARIDSYTVDSTGTTEVQSRSMFTDAPAEEDRVELSSPVAPGGTLASERLLFTVGDDYHAQLEAYGAAIRQLHHARVGAPNLMGWWSWTAHYNDISAGKLLTNAQWLAQHLRGFGYDWFHIDSGYEYAPGEFTTANAARFPRGMRALAQDVRRLGLNVSLWTAPFYVGQNAWVYQHHQDWLVHNARGEPIRIMRKTIAQEAQDIFVLDTTHPGAQQYLRETYRTFVKEWGVRHFKFDFMDDTAIEGYYHRPHTSALEAQRIGLEIIRKAVGDDVLLNKDGSPMLNPVGLVDEGRISQDTAHAFWNSREAASGIAARYYMHRNFFVNDADAFTISRQVVGPRARAPLTPDEAQVSIVLAVVSGGAFEIGDDLPTLALDPHRLPLVTNSNLLQMVRLGRAAQPLDLMTYRSADEQPSVFLLHEDQRQSMLAVFNWTEQPQSHSFKLSELSVSPEHSQPYDALAADRPVALDGETIVLQNQPPHSVRLIKILDSTHPAAAPALTAQVPAEAKIGEELRFSAAAQVDAVPATAFHWDFGDGIVADGASLTHAYTKDGTFTVSLTADGIDGIPAHQTFTVAVNGALNLKDAYRYEEPSD